MIPLLLTVKTKETFAGLRPRSTSARLLSIWNISLMSAARQPFGGGAERHRHDRKRPAALFDKL